MSFECDRRTTPPYLSEQTFDIQSIGESLVADDLTVTVNEELEKKLGSCQSARFGLTFDIESLRVVEPRCVSANPLNAEYFE